MFTPPQAVLDLIFQAIAQAAWNRPELAKLREPIQQALVADTFRQLTDRAFQTFADRSSTDLPEFFDEGFIRMPAVQEHLGAYIVKGEQADLNELAGLYAKRYLRPASAPDVRTHLAVYLRQVRETFATDTTYGPILLARDVQSMMQSMTDALNNLPGEMHGRFDEVVALLYALRKESDEKPLDRRDQEIAYLDRMLLEHSVWQTVYTPMAGVARIRQRPDKLQIKRAVTTITPMFNTLRQDIAETFAEAAPVIEESFEDIIEVVKGVKQVVVMGDPGAGKTTTLWKLVADYAEAAKHDTASPLPVLLKLGALSPGVSVHEQIQAQLGGLPLDNLLAEKRLALLIDALNELPAERRKEKADQVRDLVEKARKGGLIAAVTCRREDYKGDLDLNIEVQVQIAPLDVHRIRQFCVNHLPEHGEKLFWDLAGDIARRYWEVWQREEEGDFTAFWLSARLCRGTTGTEDHAMQELREALTTGKSSRSMLALARNPYMLFMMTEVFSETGSLPPNRGKLFAVFTHYLLQVREKLAKPGAEALGNALAALAYQMQTDGLGTAVERNFARLHLDEEQLYQAVSANLLDGSDPLRFTHQLLQEYFAARKLDQEMQNSVPASQFWPPDRWWHPQGWEETAILLAGLYSDDTTPVIEWLRDANPSLVVRCILESGAHTPPETQEALRPCWLPKLTEVSKLLVERAAVGRAIGLLQLDSREEVGLKEGIPDIAWAEIPAGPFQMGGDEEANNAWAGASITLPYAYWIAKHPVTYAQYEVFVNSDGYSNQSYWTEAGLDWKEDKTQPRYWHDPQWHISNHPVIGVTWYEAVAFCRWLMEKLRATLPAGWEIRLPTEAEWEKAARYPDGRKFPWGNKFSASKCNVSESEIGRTTAVGMYPDGANPATGIHDLSGNVWEWSLSQWAEKYHYPEDNTPEGDSARGLRGGSWHDDANVARAASRNANHPLLWLSNQGFRVVCAAPI